ncbi:VanZ family protein [Methylomarinum vadi]|uniref:VanZ family protein n=1 Tax=Methylomarinum vadi TaxID=438855 RepID=UPI0004DF9D34|nr:VanZ family protein [Methylomarinum vadi]
MLKRIDFSLLLSYCSLIYYLSNQPVIKVPMFFTHQDKLHHFGAYFLMGILAWRCSASLNNAAIIRFFLTFGFCSIYGASDEWHQSFVPGRESDIWDWSADAAGALSAAIWLLLINNRQLNLKRRQAGLKAGFDVARKQKSMKDGFERVAADLKNFLKPF